MIMDSEINLSFMVARANGMHTYIHTIFTQSFTHSIGTLAFFSFSFYTLHNPSSSPIELPLSINFSKALHTKI